jgi:hypothetical protein
VCLVSARHYSAARVTPFCLRAGAALVETPRVSASLAVTVSPRVRWVARLIAVGALFALGMWHLYYHTPYTLDDAYISFRYSRNVARGVGLVYNPGEYVKGYSNSLYTLLMAVPELFGRDPIGLAKSLGALAFVVIAALSCKLYWAAPTAAVRDRALWLLLLLSTSAALAMHSVSGLETGVHSALLFAGIACRLREQQRGGRPWSALLFAALTVSRPEGILLFVALAGHDVLFRLWTRRKFGRAELYFYLLPPLVYAAELTWSKAYYGSALPQTYYAKTSATHGVSELLLVLGHGLLKQLRPGSYLAKGLGQAALGLPTLIALPLALIQRQRRLQNSAFALAVLAQLAFIARAGDDWAPAFRFGVPLLPPLFVLIVEACGALAAFARAYARPVGWLLFGIVAAFIVPGQRQQSRQIQAVRYVNAENKLNQGAFFANLAEPGITLASFDIGGQGYAAGGFDIFDSAGLTLRETAGCPARSPARCTHFARLVLPELLRLHNNRRRDAYVSHGVSQEAPYLALDGGKYLLRRALVFMAELPEWAQARSPAAVGGAELVAVDLPTALPAGQSTQISLYFRHAGALTGLVDRRLEWLGVPGHFTARASESLLQHVARPDVWRGAELFADLISIRAPGRAGRYQLHVVAGSQRVELGAVDVLATGQLERAGQLLAQAHGESELRTLHQLARAVEVSAAAARAPYQHAVVVSARRLRGEAIDARGDDPQRALRILQGAKLLLHRAFWQSGAAARELRREIDANAALKSSLITELLGPD